MRPEWILLAGAAVIIGATGCSGSGAGPVKSSSATDAWIDSPQLRSETLPARPGEGHGCLQTDVEMLNGTGTGSGKVDAGSPQDVIVHIAGLPQQGKFTPDGPTLRIYALYCSAVNQAAGKGAQMIDAVATDESGRLVAITPPDLYEAVVGAIKPAKGAALEFDPDTLNLAPAVRFSGLTLTPGLTVDQVYEFNLNLQADPANGGVAASAGAISVPKPTGDDHGYS